VLKDSINITVKKSLVEKAMYYVPIAFLIFIVVLNSFTIIPAGERGVIFNKFSGVEEQIFDEGFHLKIPFVQQIIKMEVRTLKIEVGADSASKDLQDVQTTIALNFHLDPTQVNNLYQTIGLAYRERIINPSIQESVKDVTAQFTAEELITKRTQVRIGIKESISEKLAGNFLIVDALNIVDFQFSPEFDKAIEAKVTAEQQALKAERDLDRIRIEAQQREAIAIGVKKQKIAEAEGEAEAIRIIESQLSTSPTYIEWLKANKWDGILPKVTSGAVPFVDITKDVNS